MRLDHIIVSVPKHDHLSITLCMAADDFPGDHREAETPVPIPNTTVKRFFANGTAVRLWESRSSPGFFLLSLPFISLFSLPFILFYS